MDLGGSTRRVGKAVAAWILIALLLVLLGFLIHLAQGQTNKKGFPSRAVSPVIGRTL